MVDSSKGVLLTKIRSRSYPVHESFAFMHLWQEGLSNPHYNIVVDCQNSMIYSVGCCHVLTFTLLCLQVLQANDFPATPTMLLLNLELERMRIVRVDDRHIVIIVMMSDVVG